MLPNTRNKKVIVNDNQWIEVKWKERLFDFSFSFLVRSLEQIPRNSFFSSFLLLQYFFQYETSKKHD
jgi:hypothetical protein